MRQMAKEITQIAGIKIIWDSKRTQVTVALSSNCAKKILKMSRKKSLNFYDGLNHFIYCDISIYGPTKPRICTYSLLREEYKKIRKMFTAHMNILNSAICAFTSKLN
jgi:hypothetical protein